MPRVDKAYLETISGLFDIPGSAIRLRNPSGCEKCRRANLPELAGFRGRTVVAEMIEPDETFLGFVRQADNIELQRYTASLRASAYDEPDMTGKSALECSIYKMGLGLLDPREIEVRFEAFKTLQAKRVRQAEYAQRRKAARA